MIIKNVMTAAVSIDVIESHSLIIDYQYQQDLLAPWQSRRHVTSGNLRKD